MTKALALMVFCGSLFLNACAGATRYSSSPERGRTTAVPGLPVIVDPEIQAVLGERSVPQQSAGILAPTSERLEGGIINRRGQVFAVVFPLAYGLRRPAWTEQEIAYHIFGVAKDSLERADGVAARLADASRGVLRLNAAMVMPTLIDTEGSEAQVVRIFQSADSLRALSLRLISPWLGKTNLSSYDNDGPDGLPSSGDDDGLLDLPIVLLETDNYSASTIVPVNEVVRTGPGGRFLVKIGSVLVIALPRDQGLDPDNVIPTMAIVRALGVRGEPVFTAGHPAGELSVESRLQLGWAAITRVVRSGEYSLLEGAVFSVPVLDVPGGASMWLVEKAWSRVYATRMVRRRDGAWVRSEHKVVEVGDNYSLALTGLGNAGPIAQIEWRGESAVLRANLNR